jgi:hypothetical protein
MQLLTIEPLALVGTAVAEPDERELAIAQRRHVPSQRTSKTRGKEPLHTEAPHRREDASSSYKSFPIVVSLRANVVVSHTFLDRISTDLIQERLTARSWLKFEHRP